MMGKYEGRQKDTRDMKEIKRQGRQDYMERMSNAVEEVSRKEKSLKCTLFKLL